MDERTPMTAMARPKTDRGTQPDPIDDDPLVELARIVSGRSTFDEPKRRSVFEDDSGLSEADLARDLEAELLSDLQATFAAAGDADDGEEPPFYADEDYADQAEDHAGEEAVAEPEPYYAEEPYQAETPYQPHDDGAAGYAPEEEAYEPAPPAPEPQAPTTPATSRSGFRSAFSGFSLRGNRGGPAFNPSALSTETVEPPLPAPPAAERPRTGWEATAEEMAQEEELTPVAPPTGFDDQEDWGLDAEPEAIDPVYQESLAAAGAFVDETADVAPPPPPPRHRDARLDADPYGERQYAPRRRGRRYYSVFAILALVAIGTATVLVLRGGGATGGDAPLITADAGPTRVFPDATTPTDDAGNVVFDRVDPAGAAPAETTLLAGAEPVTDVGNTVDTEDGIGAMLAPTETADANPADLPRMVRTVTVLPDGTIVDNNTAPAGAATADNTAAATPAPTETAAAGTPAAETPAATPATETPPVTTAEAPPTTTETPAVTPATPTETPAATPAAETAPVTIAAATPTETPPTAAAAIPAGIYVQVSAQGTEAAAQSTLQETINRAPSILTGEPTAIDRADLPQGTYFRVLFGPYSGADAEALRQRLAAVGIDSFIQRY